MASLMKRPRSPYWWIQFRDTSTGKVRRQSTKFRHDDPLETRKARELRVERELQEIRLPSATAHMKWDLWVMPFLEARHAASPKTLRRKQVTWRTLSAYLEEKHIPTPAHLKREHCLDYLPWRRKLGHLLTRGKNRRPLAHNTTLGEVKCLGSIVQEAIRRQWIPSNPCYRLEIAKEMPKQKPELTDGDIALIRAGIAAKLANPHNDEEREHAEFLRVSFEIALGQGCRMFETYLDIWQDVNLDNMEITFLAKGRKRYTAPLSPKLVPLFKQLRERGQQFTYKQPRLMSLVWFKFLDVLRRRHPQLQRVSFHSTRVSVITRLGRAGVPEQVAMRLVNHASSTIHRVYRRVDASELPKVWQALEAL